MGRRDCIHVMQGPSWMSTYCNLSMSSTKSAVTAHVLTDGVSPDVSINVTPGAVDTGNRPSRELRDIAEEIGHPAAPGHQAGHAS